MDAAAAIWAEESLGEVLERLGKAIAFVVGATATNISKVEGPRLADMTKHALRDVDLGEDFAYLIADYPVTQEVLETATVRSISFLDDEVDSGEAFVLRELQMNAVMLVPLSFTTARGVSSRSTTCVSAGSRRRTRRSHGSSSVRPAAGSRRSASRSSPKRRLRFR